MATVVNKTTFQVLRSVNTPDYPTADWLIAPAGLAALESGSVPSLYWKLTAGGDDIEEMTAGEKTAADDDPANLDPHKEVRYQEIDKRTRELITVGFVHATKTFSLSEQAQSKWHGKYNARADVTFPFDVATIDNDAHTVADGAEAKTMYLLVVNTVNGHIESGGALKKSIFDAVDKAAVDAVVDTR